MTAQLKIISGTAGSPGLRFTAEQSGLYLVGTGQVGVSVNGVSGLTVQAASTAAGAGLLGTSGAVLLPVGIVQLYAGTTAPTGWFLCYGQALATGSYPELYSVLGTTYGTSSAGNFLLPDCRGRIMAGVDNMGGSTAGRIGTVVTDNGTIVGTTLGSTGGQSTHAQTLGEMAAHNHGGNTGSHTHPLSTIQTSNTTVGGTTGANFVTITNLSNTANTDGAQASIATAGSSTAMSWLQPTMMMNQIIFAGRA